MYIALLGGLCLCVILLPTFVVCVFLLCQEFYYWLRVTRHSLTLEWLIFNECLEADGPSTDQLRSHLATHGFSLSDMHMQQFLNALWQQQLLVCLPPRLSFLGRRTSDTGPRYTITPAGVGRLWVLTGHFMSKGNSLS